jgi:hypothetical protein
MPAVSVAIVRDGRLAWLYAFGVKDADTGAPVDVNSVHATWEGLAWHLEQIDGLPLIFSHAGQTPATIASAPRRSNVARG